MPAAITRKQSDAGPKKRPRHHSYDESVDEPTKLLEQEPVETEAEVPSEDTEAIEQPELPDSDGPAFEE